MALSLGLGVGSTSVKACLLADGREVWSEVRAHEGDPGGVAFAMLSAVGLEDGTSALVTGNEGRRRFRLNDAIEPEAIEAAVGALGLSVRAVVCIGGEDLVVYTLDAGGRVIGTYAGNKCASGTGEFFSQQLERMDLEVEDVARPEVGESDVHRLSSRCSVFMKSDCTHKLNKGEADKFDIALSLSNVMARKVLDFLARARIDSGRVLLAGGATKNPHLVRFIRDGLREVEFLLPAEAPYLEAYGAACLAKSRGGPMPGLDALVGDSDVAYARGAPLAQAKSLVTFVPSRRTKVQAGRRYVLGVDGGSTTTKVALVDAQTHEIAASHYGRTLGDPVTALKRCLAEVKQQLESQLGAGARVAIDLVATTGSSRELLGVFCGTDGIYNEIIAHTVGTTFFDPEIDTIFEIGGQDAKYVHLRNRVPVDYAMNEACSAGTGSFLEESAAGDLDLRRAEEIGPVALEATAPLRFGEHCSAFINSDIRKAIQQGASRPDIVAGLVLSIVSNYLNRVVGNRRVGHRIVLQGGVAKNSAVPLAFASLLGKPVVVPPDPELMGSFGVALLALRKCAEGALSPGAFDLDELLAREIRHEKEYRCRACENLCPIRILRAGEERWHFGGRCNKYANLRRRTKRAGAEAIDWVEERRRLYFEKYAADPKTLVAKRNVTVGVPEALSVHSLWPLYSHFFHELGLRTLLVPELSEKGVARCESSFCFPAEIAHGTMGTLLERDADFWFLPQFKAMPSYESDVHACLCPIMQAVPYYLRTAFGLEDARILRPVLDFTKGFEAGAGPLVEMAERLGFTRAQGEKAFAAALAQQRECMAEALALGRGALDEAREANRPVIVLFGRPYNAFAQQANMGIPRKFTTRGYTVIPYDFLPIRDEKILPNMYWYYGQQDLKGAARVKDEPNLFACFVTNFSCAPDSFILHFNRWIYNTKPFLVLELDSHTADAGLDTRVEAFLDIIEGYRRANVDEQPMFVERDWDVRIEGRDAIVVNRATNERRRMTDKRVRLVWPSMGRVGTQLVAATARSAGIDAVALPPADIHTAARARAVASGKECIPALLVLGAFLEYLEENPNDGTRVDLLFMPITTGPCRTGQYAIYYQHLFQELGYRNVVVLSLNSDNSYSELGNDFNRRLWKVIAVSDFVRDISDALRALAVEPAAAAAELEAVVEEMLVQAERGTDQLLEGLNGWADRLARVPLAKKLADARKVLVVGEIFVRRDDYSVNDLVGKVAERGVVSKITGLTEWIHYLDWDQARRLRKALDAMPAWKRPLASETRQLAFLRVEMMWKAAVEERIRKALSRSGLVPDAPHGMKQIMARADEFASDELESEATLSPCSAAIAMDEGYDGAAIIAPFACLPGRLIEAIYAPWARSRGLPVLSIENDGNPYPPNVVSRLEIFAHNVARGVRGGAMQEGSGGACGGCGPGGCGPGEPVVALRHGKAATARA